MRPAGSWLWVLVAVVFGLAGAPGLALARGGGGGGHYVVVTGVVRVAPIPLFYGDEATLALQITDAAPTAVDGDMKLGDIIAEHTIQSSDAIVLMQPVKGRHGDLPTGVVLARMRFAAASQIPAVWCDIRKPQRLFYPQEHDCFEDRSGNGRLTQTGVGDSMSHFLGFSDSGVSPRSQPVAVPPPYRHARADERPIGALGYKYCDGDGVSTPPRFALALTMQDRDKTVEVVGACRFGIWPDPADRSKVELDGFMIEVKPSPGGTLHYHVQGRLPAEDLGLLRPDQPVQNVADTPSRQDLDLTKRASLTRPMFALTGEPPKIMFGTVGLGQVFASAQIKHNITGVLLNRVSARSPMLAGGTTMEVGQAMFGVPYGGLGGDGIAWCAAIHTPTEGYKTTCLSPPAGEASPRPMGYYWNSDVKTAMDPNRGRLGWIGSSGLGSSDPSVKLGPVLQPPMTVTLKLAEVTTDKAGVPVPVYHLEFDLDWGDGPQMVGKDTYELTASGKVIQFWGLKMQLKPGADAAHMVVEPAS